MHFHLADVQYSFKSRLPFFCNWLKKEMGVRFPKMYRDESSDREFGHGGGST